MKPLRATLPILVSLLLLLTAAGCERRIEQDPSRAPGAEPPPLPADLQPLAPAPSPAATAAALPGAAPEAPAPGAPDTDSRVAATGEFVSPVRSNLASRIPGRVGRVLAEEGERVRRGQPLLQLETDYLQLDLARAEAEAARTEALVAEAKRDFARKEELIQKESVPQSSYDRSRSGLDQAEAARAAARAGLDLARTKLRDATLLSPVDGYVEERRTQVGQRLDEGTVAFLVVQTAPLKLRFRLPERYLARVRQGDGVTAAVDPYPGESFAGSVAMVGQAIEPATRTFPVEAEFANADGRLRPGLFARVELDLATPPADAPPRP